MAILFYLTDAKYDPLGIFSTFLDHYISLDQRKIIVLTESNNNRKILLDTFDARFAENRLEFLELDDKGSAIKNIFDQHHITAVVYCNGPLDAFRSDRLLSFVEESNSRNISFSWIARTPLKGRFTIYDDLFYSNAQLSNDYQSTLTKGLSSIVQTELSDYKKIYIKMKQTSHNDLLTSLQGDQTKSFLAWIDRLTSYVMQNISTASPSSEQHVEFQSTDVKRPFLLYLLTKENHWYTSYANPEISDRLVPIKEIYKHLPDGYDLVLKSHPRYTYDRKIERAVKSLKNCRVEYSITDIDLLHSASVILFTGTTAGVEALLYNKRIIEIGNNSIAFNFNNPPIRRVKHLAELGSAIKDVLTLPSPENRIEAYIHSLLNNSYPFNTNDSLITPLI